MTTPVNPIPPDFRGVVPYLTVSDASAAIAFYCQVFGAVETMRIASGDRIGHAELLLGGAALMLSDECPQTNVRGPHTIGGSPVCLMLYVDDVDAVVERALAAGATLLRPVENQFYGDRGGKLSDPFGHIWWLASRIEDLAPDEIQRRAKALHGGD